MTQPSTVPEDDQADIANIILDTMRELCVPCLPRNYEIFYEAYAGSNTDLRSEISGLGANPEQALLDQIGNRYFPRDGRQEIVESAHDQINDKIEEIVALLGRERTYLEKYGVILDRTSGGLSRNGPFTPDLMQKIIGIMAVATTSTIEQNKQIVTSIVEKSTELEQVKSKLEEYKKLADTDALTHIANRRAFDRELARVYEDKRSILFNALILGDIDCFKEVNDQFGHPVGDKVLQHVANIFSSSGPAGAFVARTGGEEFALIVEGLTEDATVHLAEDIRAMIENTPFIGSVAGGKRQPITISMGVCMASDARGSSDLYAKVDKALYASKMNGRNRVTRYSAEIDAPAKPRKNWLLYRRD